MASKVTQIIVMRRRAAGHGRRLGGRGDMLIIATTVVDDHGGQDVTAREGRFALRLTFVLENRNRLYFPEIEKERVRRDERAANARRTYWRTARRTLAAPATDESFGERVAPAS
jgi:hypothetical protein